MSHKNSQHDLPRRKRGMPIASLLRLIGKAMVVSLLVYPILEFAVWTRIAMVMYCPHPDSMTASWSAIRSQFETAQRILISDYRTRSPRAGLMYAITQLSEPRIEIAIPIALGASAEGIEDLAGSASGSTFIVFGVHSASQGTCADSSGMIKSAISKRPIGYRSAVEEQLRALHSAGKCLSVSFSRAFSADYFDVLTDSEVATSAGVVIKQQSMMLPIDPALGRPIRIESGKFVPSLPISAFLVRTMSNGFIACGP